MCLELLVMVPAIFVLLCLFLMLSLFLSVWSALGWASSCAPVPFFLFRCCVKNQVFHLFSAQLHSYVLVMLGSDLCLIIYLHWCRVSFFVSLWCALDLPAWNMLEFWTLDFGFCCWISLYKRQTGSHKNSPDCLPTLHSHTVTFLLCTITKKSKLSQCDCNKRVINIPNLYLLVWFEYIRCSKSWHFYI